MYCWNCGFLEVEYAKFCPSCGQPRQGPAPRPVAPEARAALRGAVDGVVKEGRRVVNAPRPRVARGAEAVERTAKRVKARANRK